jgi:hypothetical protein
MTTRTNTEVSVLPAVPSFAGVLSFIGYFGQAGWNSVANRSADGRMAMLLKSVMRIAVCVVRKTKNTQYVVRKTHDENE